MKTIYNLIILLLSLNLYSQTENYNTTEFKTIKTKPNDKANIKITDWIANIPKDKNLNNKFIVLNFLQIECTKCDVHTEVIKHLNELQSKFDNKNLYFITLTSEKPEIIKKFLKKRNINSIIASDQRKINSFWTGGIEKLLWPTTLLIDNNGIIKYILHPNDLDEKMVQSLVDGTLETFDMYMYTRNEK